MTLIVGDRAGFDSAFLTVPVTLPRPSAALGDDLLVVDGSAAVRYTHFSLGISKSRQMARWVAWNVDGAHPPTTPVGREGDPFRLDPRVDARFQIPDSYYSNNRLDRGHIARREDLVWGSSAEAESANQDSFFLTNITPQMDDFNRSSKRGVWGQLENSLLSQERLDHLRVSLLGGPVLAVDDPYYQGHQVPQIFWKLVVYSMGGQPRARAFKLEQHVVVQDALAPSDLDLHKFDTFAIDAEQLQSLTSLEFSRTIIALLPRAKRGPTLDASQPHVIRDVADLNW